MKDKIKKYWRENKEEIIVDVVKGALASATGIATYVYVNKRRGYIMNKAYQYDDNFFYVMTPRGKIFKSAKQPTEE